LFKSLGIAIEDVAVGALVYERARDRGIGRTIPLGDSHFRDA
jgi:ornithine cyclodeaminase/alanine dehydrogenase-like protein (mu-crystallin family)